MLLIEFLFWSGSKKNRIYIFCISNYLYLQEHPINNMKKEFFDTTALLSFFIRIPCKTNTIKSVQCKPDASRSASPHNLISRADTKKIMSTAFKSNAKVRSIGSEMLNIRYAAFCNLLLVTASGHRLEQ